MPCLLKYFLSLPHAYFSRGKMFSTYDFHLLSSSVLLCFETNKKMPPTTNRDCCKILTELRSASDCMAIQWQELKGQHSVSSGFSSGLWMTRVHSSKDKSELGVCKPCLGVTRADRAPFQCCSDYPRSLKDWVPWSCQMPHRHFTEQEGQSYKEDWADNMHSRSLFLGNYIPDNCPFPSPGHLWESEAIMRGHLDWVSRCGLAKGVIHGPGLEWQEGPAMGEPEHANMHFHRRCCGMTTPGRWARPSQAVSNSVSAFGNLSLTGVMGHTYGFIRQEEACILYVILGQDLHSFRKLLINNEVHKV